MVQRGDVVAHLLHVISELAQTLVIARLVPQEISDIRLCSFDPRTQDGLESDIGGNEEVWVREQPADAAQPVQCSGGLIKLADQLVVVVDAAGERLGVVRPVAAVRDLARTPSGCRGKVLGPHAPEYRERGAVVKDNAPSL